jgi:HTH-type transcriptional regulator / antitoxin HigA
MSATRTTRAKGTTSPAVGDDYLDLVKQFPLRPIRSQTEMKQAGDILDRLVGRDDLTPGQQDYLAALARFVREYEGEALRATLAELTPIDIVRHLMQENHMNTSDLGMVLGSRGLASEVLNGKRGLSKTLIAKLAKRFRVDPALFLEVEEETA